MARVPVARPSSTVVLAREAIAAPELLLVRRHPGSSFGGAFAFPGGVLEASDNAVAAYCDGMTAADADRYLDVSDGLDYFSAAIRELFEETGVLLADNGVEDFDAALARDRLNAATLDWASFVADNGLRLRCDSLLYFSFWITPDALPKRYSTRFFLATMPDDQDASHCGGELTESCWLTVSQALDAVRAGAMTMHFPTRKTLELLADYASMEALTTWAAARMQAGVACIHPKIVTTEGERRVLVDNEDAGALN